MTDTNIITTPRQHYLNEPLLLQQHRQQTNLLTTLSDLGKSTRRGIKRCPKCGIYNGTRGLICKNQNCDAVLKDSADRRKTSLEAIKLLASVRQIYSVRVRDRGPDHRGFIQLPLFLGGNSDISHQNNSSALCFVDTCQRLFDTSILCCHENSGNEEILPTPLCVHIDAAIRSKSIASPINFNEGYVTKLKCPDEIKRTLWMLAREEEGPLVQRVSKGVFAVKCQVSSKHPLGYLHFTFGSSKGNVGFDQYNCSCTEFLEISSRTTNVRHRCVHYYACICALASDQKCSEEFSYFITQEFAKDKSALYNNNRPKLNGACSKKIYKPPPNSPKIELKTPVTTKLAKSQLLLNNNKRKFKKYKKLAPKIYPVQIRVLDNLPANDNDASILWNYSNWSIYVVESINQTVRFENYGILNTLAFQIPQAFYDEFKTKIPVIYQENHLQRELYQIMNILHLKQIFDTPEVKLKISKRFVHHNENGYLEHNENEENSLEATTASPTIIFFINVGQSTIDESDNTNNPFLIEWIPRITDISNIGQLRFQYKFGRKCI